MRTSTILLLLVLFTSNDILSQNTSDSTRQTAIDFLLKEKMRFSPEKLLERMNNPDEYFKGYQPPQKIKKNQIETVSEKEVYDGEVPESEVHAAINPKDSNNIIISPIKAKENATSPSETITCPVYYTKDFGNTWKLSSFINSPKMLNVIVSGGGDPILAFDKSGKAYLSWIDLFCSVRGTNYDSSFNYMSWAYTTDGGINWKREPNDNIASTKAKYSSGSSAYGLKEFYDKQWMAVDMTNGTFQNNLYVSLTKLYFSGYQQLTDIYVYRKPASSSTVLTLPTKVNSKSYNMLQFSNIEVDSKGIVHVLFYGNDKNINGLYHSYSSDGGVTFSKEVLISNFVFAGGLMIPGDNSVSFKGFNPSRLYPCPQMAIDNSRKNSGGNIYVVWTAVGINQNDGDNLNVYLSRSENNGVSWSAPIVIHDINPSFKTCQFYPSIRVNPDGVLIIGWYDRYDDKYDSYTDYYLTYSFDGGTNFVKKIKVTSQKSDFSMIGKENGQFGIGEYTALLATKGYAIPVWSDGRNNNGDINIYTAFVPIMDTGSVVHKITPVNAPFELKDPAPNPVKDNLKISFKLDTETNVKLEFIDVIGKVIQIVDLGSIKLGDYSYDYDVRTWATGNYYVKMTTDFGYSVKSFQIIK